ncbi:MAG: hypothetical protein ABIP64_02490 [Burkholderiales bacterium]
MLIQIRHFSFVVVIAVLVGCSMLETKQPGPPPVKPPTAYTKPEVEVVSDIERIAWRPKRVVWKKFMLAVSRTPFFIDHIDEAKGEFQVHYSGDPRNYVDCGRVMNTVKMSEGDKTYDFPAASPYQQYQIMRKDKLYQVERRMSLEATVRMVLEAIQPEKTRVATASNYTLTRDQTVVGGSARPQALTDTISFNTGETGVFPNAATKCQPTGKLENEILGLLK